MKQIIRIDKGDGSESVEPNEDRIHQTLNANYRPGSHEQMLTEFRNGDRQIANAYAVYECREVATEQK